MEVKQDDLELKAELLDAASDAILLLDDQGQFVYFNSALVDMSGYSREELLERGLHGIEPPEYAARIQANINILLERAKLILSRPICANREVFFRLRFMQESQLSMAGLRFSVLFAILRSGRRSRIRL